MTPLFRVKHVTQAINTEETSTRSGSTKSSSFNAIDLGAVLISLLTLTLSIVTVSPSLPYAARLGYRDQIVVIGFLLGIMNQAAQRVVPWFCIVLERRIGTSSLQNFDGLLRWSPFSSHLHILWRVWMVISLALPLGLSVLYKRYSGGVGQETLSDFDTYVAPVALPGLDQPAPGLSIMANATSQFLANARTGTAFSTSPQKPKPYGYNLIMISDTSAAALDIPVPSTLSRLQNELGTGQIYYTKMFVRGTVATYSTDFGDNREDDDVWNYYTTYGDFRVGDNYQGTQFGMLDVGMAVNDDPSSWNCSWVLLGNLAANSDDSESFKLDAFRQMAKLFKVRRHDCSASLRISRSSI